MITINDTALEDNQLIFILRITLDSSTLRYATTGITLSGNLYSDTQLLRVEFSTLQSISKNIDIYNGGGVGSLSAFEFSLSNYSGKYIENFYPSTSQDYLSARKVEVGFLWVGATTEAEITWIGNYYVNGVSNEPNKITCFCIELSDIEIKELPYYEVQKEFNNGVSYFPKAPKESLGLSIPIVYGDFTTGAQVPTYLTTTMDIATLSPCIPVYNIKNMFVSASHQCHTTASAIIGNITAVLYKYIPGLACYMAVYNKTISVDAYTNTIVGHTQTLSNVRGSVSLKGFLRTKLVETADQSDVDESNAIDIDITNYAEIDNTEQIGLRCPGTASISEVGIISDAAAGNITIGYEMTAGDATQRGYNLKYRNIALGTPADGTSSNSTFITSGTAYHNFGTSTTAKKDTEAWTIEELSGLDYILTNTTGTSHIIRVHYAYLQISNITVYSINKARSIRRLGQGGRGY